MAKNKKMIACLELLLIIIIFALPILYLVPWHEINHISDFKEYYAVSVLMQKGYFNQIYNASLVTATQQAFVSSSPNSYLAFLVPPLLCWVFYPLAWFKFKVSLYLWTIMLWLMVILSYIILCAEHKIEGRNKIWWAAFIAISGPFLEAIRLGQLCPILLLCLSLLYVGLKRKRLVPSVIGQSLFLLKPHLLLPILFFEIRRPLIRPMLFTCIVGAFGLFISCILGGFGIIASYLHRLVTDEIYGNAMGIIYSPTLRGQLCKFSFDQYIAAKISTFAYIVLLIFSFLISRQFKKSEMRFNTLFTALVPLTLCLVPHLHNYDLLLLVPGIFQLSSYSLTGFLKKLRIFILGLIGVVLILPIYIAIHYYYVLQNSLINPFFWALLIFGIGALIIEWRRPALNDKSLDSDSNY
jgi:hypothetical protein